MNRITLLTVGTILLAFSAASGADISWIAKGDGMVRTQPGIYLSWRLGMRLVPGEYRVLARVKGPDGKVFTLKALNSVNGKCHWTKGLKVKDQLTEMDFGVMVYDGGFPLAISDWNQPGFTLASVRLQLLRVMEVAEMPAVSCDRIDGWQTFGATSLAVSTTDRKEGTGALRVRVEPEKTRKWYDAGILYPVNMKKAGMVSFRFKFESEPLPFWVQLFAGDKGGVAQKINPESYNMVKGEWAYIELPVSTFSYKPQRSVVENVRALQFSPMAGFEKPTTFLIDDILLEP